MFICAVYMLFVSSQLAVYRADEDRQTCTHTDTLTYTHTPPYAHLDKHKDDNKCNRMTKKIA